MFHVPEKNRVTVGPYGSDERYGNNGQFYIPLVDSGMIALCLASDGMGWEHVSVCVYEDNEPVVPTWEEMCHIKDIFWDEDDCVLQYHPPKSDYINNHECVLHLWRPIGQEVPRPPKILVGI